jgi:hypothetical protein
MRGGVEGPVEVEGPIGVAEGELVEVRAEQLVVDLAGPLGNRENWRALRGATSVRRLSSSPGSRSQRCFDGAPCAPLRASDRAQAEGLAELAQVDRGWFALAPQRRQTPEDKQRRRTQDSGTDLFDVGVIESEADPPHFRVGVGHRVDGQHLGRFHAPPGPPAPPTARLSSSWST